MDGFKKNGETLEPLEREIEYLLEMLAHVGEPQDEEEERCVRTLNLLLRERRRVLTWLERSDLGGA